MRTPNEVFFSLKEFMFPFTLRQCFDAYRLKALYTVEETISPNSSSRIAACFNALIESDRPFGELGSIFDPFREREPLIDAMAPGAEIALLASPSQIVEKLPNHTIAELVENEMDRIEPLTSKLDAGDLFAVARIVGFAFGGTEIPSGRENTLRYATANTSWRVHQYLMNRQSQGSWEDFPLQVIVFPDVIEIQRKRLLAADIHPPFTLEELSCFTDDEIQEFGAPPQAMLASPRCRHFMVCNWCFDRLTQWQISLIDFHKEDRRKANA